MITKISFYIDNEQGTTLIEAMITILIFFIVVFAGGSFFYGGNIMTDRAKIRRLAVDLAVEKIEWLSSLDYSQLENEIENGSVVQLGTKNGIRKVFIEMIDDSLEGFGINDFDNNADDYKKTIVEVSWVNTDTQKVRLELIFYPERSFP